MINYVMGNLEEVIEKATHREIVPELPLKQRKLTSEPFVVGSQGKICSKIPSRRESSHPKGLPLRTGQRDVTMFIPTAGE